MKKVIRLSESNLMRIVKRVILENENQEEIDKLNHTKKQFLNLNNFTIIK